jgi:hypothetical protein
MKNIHYKYEQNFLSFLNFKKSRPSNIKKVKIIFFKRFNIVSNKYYSFICFIKKYIIYKEKRLEFKMPEKFFCLKKVFFNENTARLNCLDYIISESFIFEVKFIVEKTRLNIRNNFNKTFKNILDIFFLKLLKKKPNLEFKKVAMFSEGTL